MKTSLKPSFEEIQQLALEGIWRACKKFDETKSSFPTYANYRVRGFITDVLRSESLNTRRSLSAGASITTSDFPLRLCDSSQSPDTELFELKETIFSAVKEEDREITRLYFIEGYTIKEIKKITGINITKAYKKVRAIRNLLKETIIHEFPSDSILRRALQDSTFGNEFDSFGGTSTRRKYYQNSDRGSFSSLCSEGDAVFP